MHPLARRPHALQTIGISLLRSLLQLRRRHRAGSLSQLLSSRLWNDFLVVGIELRVQASLLSGLGLFGGEEVVCRCLLKESAR
jgi:hypothetical protein